jgi:hypothetical protein
MIGFGARETPTPTPDPREQSSLFEVGEGGSSKRRIQMSSKAYP